MCGLIHISIRRNLFYILYLIIYYYLRKLDLIIITNNYKFNDSLIFTFLMLSSEFIGGLSIHLYQSIFFNEEDKEDKVFEYLGIELEQWTQPTKKRPDSIFKILLLLFFASFFDFVEFIIANSYMSRISILSPTCEFRFGGLIIIIGALICYYNLKIKLKKHQLYSLIIMGVCLIIIIILEIIFRGKGVSFVDFFSAHMLVLAYLVFVPFTDVIEKYLLEYDFLSPYWTLMWEGIFGFIFFGIYSIIYNPFQDIKKIYEEISTGKFILLLFLLLLYFVFSAGTNIYKILTNGLYSPMAKALAVYILNPFLYIYYFAIENDFMSDGKKNYFYFIVNVVIAVIISFFCCVFNEFLVLSCYELDTETHFSISMRASNIETVNDLQTIETSDLEECEEGDSNSLNKSSL